MRTAILATASIVGPVLAAFDTWSPPGKEDVRAPCPMLNTLANHGFLPHSGKDITELDTMSALYDALHVNKTLAGSLFQFALSTNPDANATTFNLDHLGRHNVLEHDASLSRVDHHFGDALKFNQTIFDGTKSFFTDDVVTVEMAAKARIARIKDSQANNPEYSMSELGTTFSFGESIAYIIALGDAESGTVDRDRVVYLFENEKLPLHLGWGRSEVMLQDGDLSRMMQLVMNITEALGEDVEAPEEASPYDGKLKPRGGFHVGM